MKHLQAPAQLCPDYQWWYVLEMMIIWFHCNLVGYFFLHIYAGRMGEQTFSLDDRFMYRVDIQWRFAALHVNPLPTHRHHPIPYVQNPLDLGSYWINHV